jgi:hypothetical protein
MSSNPFQTNGHKSVLPPSPTKQVSPLEMKYRPLQRSKSSRLRPQHDQELEQVTPSQSAKDSTHPQTQQLSVTKLPRNPAQVHDTSRSQPQPALSPKRAVRQEIRSEPRQQVIRHVTATFEVPVKEEDVDDEEFEGSASASTSAHSSDVSPTGNRLPAPKTKPSYNKQRNQSKRSVLADDDESYVEDEVDGVEEPHRPASSSEEEDDELMMGTEVSPTLSVPTQRKQTLNFWM